MIRHIQAAQLTAAQTTPPASTARQQKLSSAAHEFEASLMQEFLKPLQHDALFSDSANDEDGENSDGPGGSEGALLSMGSEMFAKALSEHGGFGIADRILAQLGQTASPARAMDPEDKAADEQGKALSASPNPHAVNGKGNQSPAEKKSRTGSGNAEATTVVRY